ncbi:MAG: insulinase family protein [Rickettsiales bacterium]|jgi:predicted Zn-dependent peptidase|nr:insulinase family protein [Rickettsiales bacterium]
MENVEVHTLSNGLAVAADYIPSALSAFAGVWVSAGSASESPKQAGISHFLEHMAFKGTSERTYLDIAEQVEDRGAELNAYTAKDRTFYYIRSLKEHFEFDLELLSDIIFNSVFSEEEAAKECEVILQEYLAAQDDPDDLTGELFYEAAFGDSPLGRPVIGRPETIRATTGASLRAYMLDKYKAENMCLVVSGNVRPEEVFRLAEKYFARAEQGFSSMPSSSYTGGARIVHKDLEQTNIMLGFPTSNALMRREAMAEAVALAILGGGMSSRLFQSIRERDNLVYNIGAYADVYADAGAAYIYASTEPGKLATVIMRTAEEMRRFLLGVSDKEIARAKATYKSSLLMSLENSSARAKHIARCMQLFKRVVPAAETVSLIDSIGPGDIAQASARIFSGRMSITLLGRAKGMPDEAGVRAIFS